MSEKDVISGMGLKDFATGEFMSEEDVTQERLQTLFGMAFYKTEIDEDGDLLIRDNYRVFVTVDADRLLIAYKIYFRKVKDDQKDLAEQTVAEINDSIIYNTLAIHNGAPYICYYLDYRDGIMGHNIIHAFRRMQSVASTMMSEFYEVIVDTED
jgi:hypothetical protein